MIVISQPNLTKELLDEFFTKNEQRKKLELECKLLSDKIKYEMQIADRKKINIHGYKINIETKYEPNDQFYLMLQRKDMLYLVNMSISTSNLRHVINSLQLEKNNKLSKYMQEKKSKWLHIEKDM